ncbi:hypothetical protein RHMOL_Rhmol04G0056400 [Rhododendron molle]|uniref:Uncharacterized protein n=1 Tax=Rhododendron molle TaxID=49168 RepID=A0ACC0NXH8_RHOML|nr:hypothetical protein RHMOL_Rhmol04G0056400 [Rhododendron molle]
MSNIGLYDSYSVKYLTVLRKLKTQNLTGTLPAEFANLTFLKEIDLTRNYINGTLPTNFAKLPLTILTLWGNHINGSIPREIGDIATLEELVLKDNLLGGPLPQNLGSLTRLRRLILSGNNFTGPIPEEFSKLINLTEFTIDGSTLSGKIPDMIGNWTEIDRLDMQGTSMSGPIPSTISKLINLVQLRISDLTGSDMTFPDLQNMKKLETLVLRNCLITDRIPGYIGDLPALKYLDLSFNNLSGPIPGSLQNFTKRKKIMLLTSNSLTGAIPGWIQSNGNEFDVSYNNFNDSSESGCQTSSVNLVSSRSSTESNSIEWCVKKDLPCPTSPQYHSLYINCGGSKITAEGNDYEMDLTAGGPSYFYVSPQERWAYSSTGSFMDNPTANYLANNSFSLNMTGYAEYYETARLAPNSLKYYGLCLLKGSYKVLLHFAEIMYSDDETYSSLGRRIFDVSIQGKEVLKDFNIKEVAKGVGIGITMEYDDIIVNGSTLEIHLYWRGKGTTVIPDKGVYGPLISAITITPNFDVSTGPTGLSAGAIVGIVAASFVLLVLILVLLRMKGCLGGKDLENKELRALELQTGYFTLRQIKAATNNFDPANKIGEGGFGPVYKGVMSDGAVIAVKQLSSKSKQGNREFVNEIGMISALQHPHLVKLYGCCIEGKQLLLIYEYMENNCLARALFGREEQLLNLDWPTRKKICVGIARGLAYLHEESRLKIVHRDIKATNVLLDKDLNAKISDFGLAKLDEEENTHISTRIAGTIGYMAPEYALRGYLTDKADVYSFGIVALEIVSGKSNTNYRPKEDLVYLLDWALVLKQNGNLMELVDPKLGSNFNKIEVTVMINVALMCTNVSPAVRPAMSSVVSMLEGRTVPEMSSVPNPDASNEQIKLKGMMIELQKSLETDTSEGQIQIVPTDGPYTASSASADSAGDLYPYTASSASAGDLYPLNWDSKVLENRYIR